MAGSSCHAQPRSGCCSGGSLVRPVEPDPGALTGPHPDGGEVARRKRRPGRALDAGGGSGGALGWATALPLGVLLAVASDALSDRKAEGSNPSSDSKAAGILPIRQDKHIQIEQAVATSAPELTSTHIETGSLGRVVRSRRAVRLSRLMPRPVRLLATVGRRRLRRHQLPTRTAMKRGWSVAGGAGPADHGDILNELRS
jgi:hypothetical protein